ncbi:MAG TPA: ATP-binding protein [Methylomirabilota bacterium]
MATPHDVPHDVDALRDENIRLREQLEEAEAVLAAIRGGEIDAFVIAERHDDRVYTLETADRPYRLMVEHMQEGAALVNDDSTVCYANARLADLLRLPLGSLIGGRFDAHVGDRQAEFRELLAGDGSARLELALTAADGTPVPVMLAARELPTDEKSVCLIVTDLSDQQARRELEREVDRRQRVEHTLREADRRKNEFLAMLGHELRNPLAAISGAVRLLEHAGALEPKAAWARDVIARQSQHLARMVADLLDVGRVTSGKLELSAQPLDLDEIVRRTVAGLQNAGQLAEHRIELVFGPPLRVLGDATRLEQVVGNLVANALRYTPAGGRIRLALSRQGEMAALQVIDTGIGIPADLLPHVFDLFVQGPAGPDRTEAGLGIGLTLVQQIVQLHGGTVDVASDGHGRGATFTVYLPLTSEPLPGGGGGSRSRVPSRRVLLVEDHADSRDMLRLLLEARGHKVAVAQDGPSAVEAIAASPPDLALVDLGLPGFDGYEVARRTRALPDGNQITLVALTGYGQPEHQQQAAAAGFDGHLTKPVDVNELDGLLAKIKRRRKV